MKTISFDVNVPSNVTITATEEGDNINIVVDVVKKEQEIPKKGDFVIVWDSSYEKARIDVYDHYNSGAFDYPHCTRNTAFINAVKWDGTKEHFESVLRGEF